MNDLISRQAAIDAVKDALNPSIVNFVKAKMAIEKLPPVQPDLDSAYTEGYTAAESKYRKILDDMPWIKEAMRMSINALTAQHWIPCSERLPEKEDVYLVTFDKKCLLENEADVSDMYWIDGKWQYAMMEHYENKMPKLIVEPIEELKVVAWMPLPKAYQERKDNERA